jgi:cob(I)alamin adenosyltransferase
MKILVETKELERINKGLDLKYLNQASQLIYNEIKTIYKEKKISAHEILKSIEKEH